MTVPTEAAGYVLFDWTGAETTFNPGFRIYATAQVKVAHVPAGGVAVMLTEGVHYSVAVAPTPSVPTVTRIAFPAAAGKIVIWRATDATQPQRFDDNVNFPARAHETAHDLRAMGLAELKRDVARALLVPPGESGLTLPGVAARGNGGIGTVFGFDAAGAPKIYAPGAGIGNVIGPAGAVSGKVAYFDGSGNVLAASANLTIGPTGAVTITGLTSLGVAGDITIDDGRAYLWGDRSTYVGGSSADDYVNIVVAGSERFRFNTAGLTLYNGGITLPTNLVFWNTLGTTDANINRFGPRAFFGAATVNDGTFYPTGAYNGFSDLDWFGALAHVSVNGGDGVGRGLVEHLVAERSGRGGGEAEHLILLVLHFYHLIQP